MRSLTLTEAALRDVDAIRKWLRQSGAGPAAKRRLQHIQRAIRDLRATPCQWPYSEHPGSRERIVEGYKIIYRIEPDTSDNNTAGNVVVRRVFGPGQLSTRL